MRASGFTIIELMAVLALGMLVFALFSRYRPRQDVVAWQAVGGQLNTFATFARQHTLKAQKPHRLHFIKRSKGKDEVVLEQAMTDEETFTQRFEPVEEPYAFYTLPPDVSWDRIMRGKKSLFENDKDAYIGISSDGIFETATVSVRAQLNDTTYKNEFTLEPFLGAFVKVMHA